MKTNFVLRRFDLSDKVRDQITKRIKRFDRFFPEDTEVIITLYEEGSQEVAELTIYDTGTFYRAEQSADDVLTSIDSAIDVIEGQIRKYKTKLEKRLRVGAFDTCSDEAAEFEDDIKITNIKKFIYKPISPEEAVLQMNLVGHQFYVFKNEENDKICVVYKRNNSEYGLIEPIE
ncbi:Ribosome hibernation promotion factor [bioreactor metagenome]|uniref:Ribosome hibernation promotion factor n=1 Tax=bioreactor metagenome TaxID=1076179 RepID=A0A645ARB0_9ZZZZ|nr:ribosome-associated translation inhibitor RaiA [Oscillospiraceae bacterium]